ncbi:hypothetical protein [Thermoflexibacter ruber]|uniref:Uncharacterized protein n=1 Tax=Thermoflexibacter ruber TaxID=1003 RepID=A0A1I2IY70_9BACT|nr:hypothetical protein [Thermoflexibacter ruber]SFF45431.1 hypothetical protein SAMN04488541_103613 [Thermoflexibacter ruber]
MKGANNIKEVSSSPSFYRQTQSNYLPSIIGNQVSFFHSAINNIAYDGLYPVSLFAKNIDDASINTISFQQFIQKHIVDLEKIVLTSPHLNNVISISQSFLRQFADLFIQIFSLHYQAPKLVIHVEEFLHEVNFEFTLSPQTKIFIVFTTENSLLSYRHENKLHKQLVDKENFLDGFADLFAQYGIQYDLTVRSSIFA